MYGTFCYALVSFSCGEKKEVIEVVEEEQGADGSPSTAPTRLKKGTKKAGSAATGAAGENASESDSPAGGDPLAENRGNGETPTATPTQEQIPAKPVVSWEPTDISKILTTTCAGPCHGNHGQFANKDYFLSLKARHLIQLKGGKMPPPQLFPNFRESADGIALITWLEQQ
jgi:hypothetical protein